MDGRMMYEDIPLVYEFTALSQRISVQNFMILLLYADAPLLTRQRRTRKDNFLLQRIFLHNKRIIKKNLPTNKSEDTIS